MGRRPQGILVRASKGGPSMKKLRDAMVDSVASADDLIEDMTRIFYRYEQMSKISRKSGDDSGERRFPTTEDEDDFILQTKMYTRALAVYKMKIKKILAQGEADVD